ncbi:MAG: ATP synthase F1 subunit delta [Syntrophales bacterium]|nr:ATP synthase F1 subunit delta [Syntrophales bacterium]MDD5233738.1 ATP synthase F1 subunit delta [Syntrophales bacterium]MDD5531500.1 ATP synthase F1 subunit delta [Syntrophales bacterium]
MIRSGVAKCYAQALFDIAGEEKRYEAYHEEMKRFSSLLEENINLKEFFANPIFDRDEKKAVISEVLGKIGLSGTVSNFLKLLVDKGRIGSINDIQACYEELMYSVLKMAKIQVTTAYPLTGELSDALRKALEGMTGKKIEMQVQQDPSLVGGIVVKVGDTLYDGSIKSQLNYVRELLREER